MLTCSSCFAIKTFWYLLYNVCAYEEMSASLCPIIFFDASVAKPQNQECALKFDLSLTPEATVYA